MSNNASYEKEMRLSLVGKELQNIQNVIDNHPIIRGISVTHKEELRKQVRDKRRLRRLLNQLTNDNMYTDEGVKLYIRRHLEYLYEQYESEFREDYSSKQPIIVKNILTNVLSKSTHSNITSNWTMEQVEEVLHVNDEYIKIMNLIESNLMTYRDAESIVTTIQQVVEEETLLDFNRYIYYLSVCGSEGVVVSDGYQDYVKNYHDIRDYIHYGNEAITQYIRHLYKGVPLEKTLDELEQERTMLGVGGSAKEVKQEDKEEEQKASAQVHTGSEAQRIKEDMLGKLKRGESGVDVTETVNEQLDQELEEDIFETQPVDVKSKKAVKEQLFTEEEVSILNKFKNKKLDIKKTGDKKATIKLSDVVPQLEQEPPIEVEDDSHLYSIQATLPEDVDQEVNEQSTTQPEQETDSTVRTVEPPKVTVPEESGKDADTEEELQVITKENDTRDLEKLVTEMMSTVYGGREGNYSEQELTSYNGIKEYVENSTTLTIKGTSDETLLVIFEVDGDTYYVSPFYFVCESPFKIYYDATGKGLLEVDGANIYVASESKIVDDILHIIKTYLMTH